MTDSQLRYYKQTIESMPDDPVMQEVMRERMTDDVIQRAFGYVLRSTYELTSYLPSIDIGF